MQPETPKQQQSPFFDANDNDINPICVVINKASLRREQNRKFIFVTKTRTTHWNIKNAIHMLEHKRNKAMI